MLTVGLDRETVFVHTQQGELWRAWLGLDHLLCRAVWAVSSLRGVAQSQMLRTCTVAGLGDRGPGLALGLWKSDFPNSDHNSHCLNSFSVLSLRQNLPSILSILYTRGQARGYLGGCRASSLGAEQLFGDTRMCELGVAPLLIWLRLGDTLSTAFWEPLSQNHWAELLLDSWLTEYVRSEMSVAKKKKKFIAFSHWKCGGNMLCSNGVCWVSRVTWGVGASPGFQSTEVPTGDNTFLRKCSSPSLFSYLRLLL